MPAVRALELRPDLRGAHFALGELYLESGDYEKAEREFRDEARLASGSGAAAFKLGVVLINRGEISAALAELERANTLQPDMPETLLELGKVRASSGDVTAAERLFRSVIELERDSRLTETAHLQLSLIYRKLGRTADADRETKLFRELRKARK